MKKILTTSILCNLIFFSSASAIEFDKLKTSLKNIGHRAMTNKSYWGIIILSIANHKYKEHVRFRMRLPDAGERLPYNEFVPYHDIMPYCEPLVNTVLALSLYNATKNPKSFKQCLKNLRDIRTSKDKINTLISDGSKALATASVAYSLGEYAFYAGYTSQTQPSFRR